MEQNFWSDNMVLEEIIPANYFKLGLYAFPW